MYRKYWFNFMSLKNISIWWPNPVRWSPFYSLKISVVLVKSCMYRKVLPFMYINRYSYCTYSICCTLWQHCSFIDCIRVLYLSINVVGIPIFLLCTIASLSWLSCVKFCPTLCSCLYCQTWRVHAYCLSFPSKTSTFY
jgi:hypothetical protein